ncbi:hypothetical protein [Salipaludibacillus keqinensis]|uniref:hypothetical protein n=1 Tax=Salipaludibacillus keqinensis TaxID=2045207 RepID=UPI0018EE9722|nr:hypothetical protein [Salipaludibacillus keqinensis]
MEMILYDFFLVAVGIFIGVIAADPMKKLFTGGYKEEAKQKKRVKLLLYLRETAKNEKVTTEELCEHVFRGKEDMNLVHRLLKDIEATGLIKGLEVKGDISNKKWFYKDNKARSS